MNKTEAFAYKLAMIWQEQMKKEYPNEGFVQLRKKGDPRKSMLFKVCYKLIRETKGFLEPREYRFYILAQIQMMGKMRYCDIHALIEPSVLIGPNAWKRWNWWKQKNEKNMRLLNRNSSDFEVDVEKIKIELQNTKKLIGDDLPELMKNRKLHEWLATGKISPYFIILHPFFEGKDINKLLERDLSIYKITDEVRNIFKDIYIHEQLPPPLCT